MSRLSTPLAGLALAASVSQAQEPWPSHQGATPSADVANALLRTKLPDDPGNFASAGILSRSPLLLIAHPSPPRRSRRWFAAATLAELDGFIAAEREQWGALISRRGLNALP